MATTQTDLRQLTAVNPHTTGRAAPLCRRLQQLYGLMPTRGWIERPDLLEKSGLHDRQFERALSAGVKLGLWQRDDRCHLPNPQPDRYRARPAGLRALARRKGPARTSPLDLLNHAELTALRHIDWAKLGIRLHRAWGLACLLAVIRQQRQASARTIAHELGLTPTTLFDVRTLGSRLGIIRFHGRKGVGGLSVWSVDWGAVRKLPRGPDVDLRPQRWLPRFNGRPGARDLDEFLGRIESEKTGLKTYQQWCRVRLLVAHIRTEWRKPREALAIALGIAVETLNQAWLPWAVRAGVIDVVPRKGAAPARLVVNRERIAELAGEQPKAETKGKPTKRLPPRRAGRRTEWADAVTFANDYLNRNTEATLRGALDAYKKAYPLGPHPTRDQLKSARSYQLRKVK